MTLSDDELKNLKHRLSIYPPLGIYPQDIRAIIARLEAAEALLPAWQQQNGEWETRLLWLEAEERWRKVTGKSLAISGIKP